MSFCRKIGWWRFFAPFSFFAGTGQEEEEEEDQDVLCHITAGCQQSLDYNIWFKSSSSSVQIILVFFPIPNFYTPFSSILTLILILIVYTVLDPNHNPYLNPSSNFSQQLSNSAFIGVGTIATRTFATPIFVTIATPIFVTFATPFFRTIATRTFATPL